MNDKYGQWLWMIQMDDRDGWEHDNWDTWTHSVI